MTKVKICGITNLNDAENAVQLGADVLGFVFTESPRQISPEAVEEIIRGLPPFIITVGLFVDEEPAKIKEVLKICPLDALQFHGRETPEDCELFPGRVIKAFRIQDEESLSLLSDYQGKVRAYLLDTFVKGSPGGTGEIFNWELALRTGEFAHPLILAGGLTPDNVGLAIRKVKPDWVDVSSGVESSPGKKDSTKIKKFIEMVRKQG